MCNRGNSGNMLKCNRGNSGYMLMFNRGNSGYGLTFNSLTYISSLKKRFKIHVLTYSVKQCVLGSTDSITENSDRLQTAK